MRKWLFNILGIVVGLIVGGSINMCIINISPYIIAPPAGVDVTSETSLKEGLKLFEVKHYLFPFLAHALGTFVGAWIATLLSRSQHLLVALIVGSLFLFGGIGAVMMLDAPLWFNITDLLFAYIPMALLGYWIAPKRK